MLSFTKDPLYIAFFYHFLKDRDYFECHEVMEELWMEERRNPHLQGLLQIAVGLYHARNGNISGAIKLFSAGIEKLQSGNGDALGIRLDALLADSSQYVEQLKAAGEQPFSFYNLEIEITDPELREAVDGYVPLSDEAETGEHE